MRPENQLFRMLRADDKEGWQRLMEGKQGVWGLVDEIFNHRWRVPPASTAECCSMCAEEQRVVSQKMRRGAR